MFAIPLSIIKYNFTFIQTLLFSVAGGVLSIFVFSFLSDKIYKFIASRRKNKVKKRSVKNILAIKTARKYGLFGIAFLTPIFLSIPIIQEWIFAFPAMAGSRALMIGIALGIVATSFRIIIGLDKSVLGG
jgi:hypothetical protein